MAKPKRFTPHPPEEQFTFSFAAGELTVPYWENVPIGVAEDASASGDSEQFVAAIIDNLFTDEQKQARRLMTIAEHVQFLKDWNEQSATPFLTF